MKISLLNYQYFFFFSHFFCAHLCGRPSLLAPHPPQKSKSSTARVVVHRELGVMNSFTLEASFAGANRGVGAQVRLFQNAH
jgi:hypothetical protein